MDRGVRAFCPRDALVEIAGQLSTCPDWSPVQLSAKFECAVGLRARPMSESEYSILDCSVRRSEISISCINEVPFFNTEDGKPHTDSGVCNCTVEHLCLQHLGRQ
ncbi:hypothetical protein BC629DRAFT_1531158 [Irpex lacteus]|nr:hypothetical protein BC629DRAFT_1531158 [Irpex lacteus]